MENNRELGHSAVLYEKIVDKGVEMRKLQILYFKTRQKSVLIAAKKAEQEFDKLLTESLEKHWAI